MTPVSVLKSEELAKIDSYMMKASEKHLAEFFRELSSSDYTCESLVSLLEKDQNN